MELYYESRKIDILNRNEGIIDISKADGKIYGYCRLSDDLFAE